MSEGRSKGTERKLIFILKEVLIRHMMVKFMCLRYRMCFRLRDESEVKSFCFKWGMVLLFDLNSFVFSVQCHTVT